ncbi:hypothetical protein [Marinilactibacillus sp. Marseille-P9653]|uniref:hypothetical protein n=1 Tax=Marinilactibacillus sp. Marseille-P9653 TaxID=2866583 RepID=UPI001CE3FDA4|nr:hypothetical protein [Marinilactibacillus sp. Marseille-P9653]
MENNNLFYDHLGNFQWTSVTTIISICVLLFQIYQQYSIKKLKHKDIRAELRLNNLKILKNGLLIMIESYSIKATGKSNALNPEFISKTIININNKNKHAQLLKSKIGGVTTTVREKDRVASSFIELSEAYSKYENEEIKNIYKKE